MMMVSEVDFVLHIFLQKNQLQRRLHEAASHALARLTAAVFLCYHHRVIASICLLFSFFLRDAQCASAVV